jgi:hypothetical protein
VVPFVLVQGVQSFGSELGTRVGLEDDDLVVSLRPIGTGWTRESMRVLVEGGVAARADDHGAPAAGVVILVSRVRDPLSTEAGDAPGWQGAKTKDIGNI